MRRISPTLIPFPARAPRSRILCAERCGDRDGDRARAGESAAAAASDGHWCGELMVDSTLCSDLRPLHALAGRGRSRRCRKDASRHIRRRQLPDGGWNIYHGGPSEMNASVKAYFALKLAGHSPDAPWMREARANILRLGGIPRMNTFASSISRCSGSFRGNICRRSRWR